MFNYFLRVFIASSVSHSPHTSALLFNNHDIDSLPVINGGGKLKERERERDRETKRDRERMPSILKILKENSYLLTGALS